MTAKLHLTRDSVAAGDDLDAPHVRVIDLPAPIVTPRELQDTIVRLAPTYLPRVEGPATWAAYCGVPVAVFSNQGSNPRPFFLPERDLRQFGQTPDGLRVHFVYFASRDPDVVFDVLSRTLAVHRQASIERSALG